jgi:DNA polymerase-3 subunit delta
MQIKGRDAAAWLKRPDPAAPGLLISGEDPMRVARARADVVAALVGPEGEAEMRLTRIAAADLRKDAALLSDATRAIGFFPGPRAVVVEDATDGLAEVIGAALADWQPGDAPMVVTAGAVTAKGALRKLFEGHKTARAITLYDDPPGPEEIAALTAAAGLRQIDPEARSDIAELARSLDPGDFRQTIEKLGLFKLGDSAPVTAAELRACAPQSQEAEVDDLCESVMDRREAAMIAILHRLYAQGTTPVWVCIALGRHVRILHALAADPGGRVRVPGGFRRQEVAQRQARDWRVAALGWVLGQVVDTDLQLRSVDTAPQKALVERLLLRIARYRGR